LPAQKAGDYHFEAWIPQRNTLPYPPKDEKEGVAVEAEERMEAANAIEAAGAEGGAED
jgi:hypothetical protein